VHNSDLFVEQVGGQSLRLSAVRREDRMVAGVVGFPVGVDQRYGTRGRGGGLRGQDVREQLLSVQQLISVVLSRRSRDRWWTAWVWAGNSSLAPWTKAKLKAVVCGRGYSRHLLSTNTHSPARG
jgi:hypothetical protein